MNSTFVCDDSFAQIMVDWEIMMIKAFFVDFYGTLVHEDGEVIKKITDIICNTGKVENRKDIDNGNDFECNAKIIVYIN